MPALPQRNPLTEAISHPIREELRKEFEVSVRKKDLELAEREKVFSQKLKEMKRNQPGK